MPDNDNSVATETQVEAPKVASIGKIQRVEMTFPKEGQVQQIDNTTSIDNQSNEGANATSDAEKADVIVKTAAAPTLPTPEQLKEYFKSLNIDYDGDDKIKEKLTTPTQTATETPEQLQAKALAKEKRILDKFIAGGGTAEQYVALKSVAEADVAELSKNSLIKELKDAGFTDDQIEKTIKERYYQLADEELDLDEDDEKERKKKLKEYYGNKLPNRSLSLKDKAAGILKGIQEAINSEDLQAQNEVAISAKIDEDFQKLPRKMSIEIGEIGGKTVSPVDYDVSESDIAEVKAILKDPAQRQQLLFNQDGSLNIARITQALLKEKAFDSASKVSFHSGMTKAIADFQTVFPARSAQELGVGGSQQRPNGQNGSKIAAVGKVQRVQPQR